MYDLIIQISVLFFIITLMHNEICAAISFLDCNFFYDFSYWWCKRNEPADNIARTYMWINLNFKTISKNVRVWKCVLCQVCMLPPMPWLERKRKSLFSSISTCSFFSCPQVFGASFFSHSSECIWNKMQCISCHHCRCWAQHVHSCCHCGSSGAF